MPTDSQQSDQESKQQQSGTIELVSIQVSQQEDLNKLGSAFSSQRVIEKDGQVFTVVVNLSDATGYWSGPIFLPNRACRVIEVAICAQGNGASGTTLDFQRYSQGEPINGSGASLLITPFDLSTGALTRQAKIGNNLNKTNCVLDKNNLLALYTNGGSIPAGINGVCISIHYVYLDQKDYNDVL